MNRLNRITKIENEIRVNSADCKRLYLVTDHEGLITVLYQETTLKNGKVIDEHLPGIKGATVKEFMAQYGGDEKADFNIILDFKNTTTEMLNLILEEAEKRKTH